MANAKKVRVDVRADKASIKTRTERAVKMGQVAQTSGLYQAQPAVKDAVDSMLKDGAALQAAEDQVSKDEAQAAKSRGIRDSLLQDFDASYGVVVSTVEKHAQTPDDISSTGLNVQQRTRYPVAPPLSISAKYNYTKNTIDLRIKKAPGMNSCLVEISPDPVGPNTYKRIDAIGSRQSLSGYAPGTWWIRAACVRGSQVSAWLGPVSVLVK